MPTNQKPPIFTHLYEILDWTLSRTADFPKSQRHTLGQKLDGLMLEALERCIEAIYAPPAARRAHLTALNLLLEKLRVFWRIVHGRGWISLQQLHHAIRRLDEVGRMNGAWMKSLNHPTPPR